jgi:hypothetical protein
MSLTLERPSSLPPKWRPGNSIRRAYRDNSVRVALPFSREGLA